VTDEWHQSFVPERMPAVDDLVADAAGAAAAVLAGGWLARLIRRRHRTI
jgi:VanZ family protein